MRSVWAHLGKHRGSRSRLGQHRPRRKKDDHPASQVRNGERPFYLSRERFPVGYFMRPPTSDDAPAVAERIAACELADAGRAEMTLDDWVAYTRRSDPTLLLELVPGDYKVFVGGSSRNTPLTGTLVR
jgi:hypothetical protein